MMQIVTSAELREGDVLARPLPIKGGFPPTAMGIRTVRSVRVARRYVYVTTGDFHVAQLPITEQIIVTNRP